MHQEFIQIGEVKVPVIVENAVRYYPISYITTKVLKRSNKNGLLSKRNKDEYSHCFKKFIVTFGENNVQESNCIIEDGLKLILSKTQQSRLTVEQRESQNFLHEHIGLPLLTAREQIKHELNSEILNEHDEYTIEIIKIESKACKKFQLCSDCEKYYPLTNIFFNPDSRKQHKFNGICHVCTGRSKIFKHPDEDKYALRKQRVEYYEAINDHNVIKIYELYLNNGIKRLPDSFLNKEDHLHIIKYLYDKGKVTKDNLTSNLLEKEYKLKYMFSYLSMHDVYTHLFGEDYYYYPWRYRNQKYKEIKLTYEVANKVVDNYIKEFGIVIDDIYSFNYGDLTRKCRITKLTNNDLLYFVVQFHANLYPGYMYKISSSNYYKIDENVLFDLRYLIEKDMQIPIDKIPLYLTKNTLQKKCQPLYRWIVTHKHRSIFEWVNMLYPNKFTLADFEINGYRNEFDSDTEMFIHEMLTEMYENVIYNQKHTDKTITIDGMIPDWFVFTDTGVWIVEYFGLYVLRQQGNSRVRDYIDKTHRKIERYKKLNGYNFIYLYPEDVENNYFGCREKLSKIGEKSIVSMV